MDTASNRTKPAARRWAMTALSLGGVALVAACGSLGINGSSSSSAPATHAMVSGSASGMPCAQIIALRSALTDLSHTAVSPSSAGRIAFDLAKAEQELNALKSQAGPFASQANKLSSGLNAIKRNAEALAKNPTPNNEANLAKAVNSFKATAQPVIREMQAICP